MAEPAKTAEFPVAHYSGLAIAAAYCMAIALFGIPFGIGHLIVLFGAWSCSTAKKRDPDGLDSYRYDPRLRKHAGNIRLLAIAGITIGLLTKLFEHFRG